MTRAVLSALLGHWRRRPFQFLTLCLGLALATALWSGVQAINAEARSAYDKAAEAVAGGLPELVAGDGAIPLKTYGALRQAGWQVSPVIEGWWPTPAGPVRLIGIDPLTQPPGPLGGAAMADPRAFLTPPGLLLAAPATAARLEDAEGLPPVTAVEGLPPAFAYGDIGVVAELLGAGDAITRLILVAEGPEPLEAVAPGLVRRPPGEAGQELARLTDSFHLNLTAFGFLSFAVGLFIVHGAVGLAFEQRRATFRTLRTLGLSARRLTAILAAELLVLSLVSGAAGLALGYGVAAALLPDVAATLRGLYGAPVEGELALRPAWAAAGLGIAVAGTALASAAGLWKVARLPLLAPARPRAWARASARAIWAQAGAAAALAALAVGAAVFGSGLVAGFALLGGLLLAAALALPPVLHLALGLFGRGARGAVADWFWADTRQQLPGLSLALMALLLALSANIGVGTMVASFRATFTGWLDQRLASELYVRAADEAEAARVLAWLDGRAEAVLPIWSAEAELFGAPAEVFGMTDHPTYRENWPILDALPGVWDRVAAGEAALVNEQLSRREGIGPGDRLALPGGAVTVAGVYSDYGNPLAQVIVATDELTRRFATVERGRYGVRAAPDAVPDLIRGLTQEVGLPPEQVTDQAALKSYSLGIFERTFAVTGALNVLTLGVAGVAILTSLLTLAAMRLPQLAPVWALGLTRGRLAALELARALMLAALTVVLAVPVGLMLAWALLAVVNVEAFGWRLPMLLFPGQWAGLGLLALAAAGLASLWPALRLARVPPAALLGVFAHER